MPESETFERRGRGRPKIGPRVTVRLPSEAVEQIDALRTVPRAEWVRSAVLAAIARAGAHERVRQLVNEGPNPDVLASGGICETGAGSNGKE